MLPTILPAAIVWGISALGTTRVWAHQKSVPLWVFILILIPASLGIVCLVRTLFRRPDFHVTADPVTSICCDAKWGDIPAAQVQLVATFANCMKYPVLLMYAYLKGTKPLLRFDEPIHIPPYSVIKHRVLFFCTEPIQKITDTYETTVIFVDAGGSKFPQRMTIRGIPRPVPVPPPATLKAVDKA